MAASDIIHIRNEELSFNDAENKLRSVLLEIIGFGNRRIVFRTMSNVSHVWRDDIPTLTSYLGTHLTGTGHLW